MQTLTFVLAIISLVSGIGSAVYWFRSAKVDIDGRLYGSESGEPTFAHGAWIGAIMAASVKTAHLNQVAAIWSGACILTGSLSTFLGYFHH